MQVLVLDCQTTGGSATTGDVLELGWTTTHAPETAEGAADVQSRLVQPADGAVLAPRITQLTGITPEEMKSAVPARDVWHDLVSDAHRVDRGPFGLAVCVVHFARFEYPFLRQLQLRYEPHSSFPLHLLCAHEIARRLYPDLPRASLRALAGYCGLTLPESKRAKDHVQATTLVWSHLVAQLSKQRDVRTLDELSSLLREPPPPRKGKWTYALPRESRLRLPTSPGVYRFLARDRSVLYVGKATSLKKRVNSYFQKRRAPHKVRELITQIHDVEVSVTSNAIDAALLESRQIRTLAPPYNTALRDYGQTVYFFSRDLYAVGSHGPSFPVGPLPSAETQRLLHFLAQSIAADTPKDDGRNARQLLRELGMDERRVDPRLLTDAVRHLLPSMSDGTRVDRIVRSLLAVGSRRLRDTFRESDVVPEEAGIENTTPLAPVEADPSPAKAALRPTAAVGVEGATVTETSTFRLTIPDSKDSPAEPQTTTVEDLVSALVEFLAQVSRIHRRAAWLRFLSGATVRWRDDESSSWEKVETKHEIGPGWDRAAYDHYRVLTTELRRLVAENAEVEIRGRSGRVLRRHWIRRVLHRV